MENYNKPTRRDVLRYTGVVGLSSAAGCASDRNVATPRETETHPDPAPSTEVEEGPSWESTLFATWRGPDPSASVTLQWLSSEDIAPDPLSVSLTRESGSQTHDQRSELTELPSNSSILRHRVHFEELTPDTDYLVSVDGSKAVASVRTAPRTLRDSITFAEGGDVGNSATVPKLHRQAAEWDPLFGLVGGDLAYANAVGTDRLINFIGTWSREMRAGDRLIPMVAAIGNHELPQGMALDGDPTQAPLYYTLFDNTQREHAHWALDIGEEISILIVDSDHTTSVAGEQTTWLWDALDERADRDHLMVASHVPAYPSATSIYGRDRDDIRNHWVPLYEAYDVDVVFEHDDHAYKRTHPLRGGEPADDGIVYVGDGAWGRSPREVASLAERPYLKTRASENHVNRVELSPEGERTSRAVTETGETLDRIQMPSSDAPEIATFRQGSDGYDGAIDTYVHEHRPDRAHDTEKRVAVTTCEYHDEECFRAHGLVRFDAVVGEEPGQVPPGSSIERATLVLRTEDLGTGVDVHRLDRAWDADVTWSDLSTDGIRSDHLADPAEPVARTADLLRGTVTIDVATAVQAWVDGASNEGFAVVPRGANGWSFHSSESESPPTLRIRYTEP